MSEEKRIIEINGVKLEVDLRNAKVIDHFRVGDTVKLLRKEYGNDFKVYPGVIVSFENFKSLPTIVVAYMKTGYSASLEFAYINEQSNEVEMVPTDHADITIEKDEVLSRFDREVVQKQTEIEEIHRKKSYFIQHFRKYFVDMTGGE